MGWSRGCWRVDAVVSGAEVDLPSQLALYDSLIRREIVSRSDRILVKSPLSHARTLTLHQINRRPSLLRQYMNLLYIVGFTPWEHPAPDRVVLDALKGLDQASTVLDLGCGSGITTTWASLLGHTSTGIDISDIALNRARVLASQLEIDDSVSFLRGSLPQWCPPEQHTSYDLIIDVGCFVGINGSQKALYAAKVADLLAPLGRYLLFSFAPRVVRGAYVGIDSDDILAIFALQGLQPANRVDGDWGELQASWFTFGRAVDSDATG